VREAEESHTVEAAARKRLVGSVIDSGYCSVCVSVICNV
jgi:hypothetical protein